MALAINDVAEKQPVSLELVLHEQEKAKGVYKINYF